MYIQPHIKTVLCAVVLCISVCGLLSVSGCIKPDKETLAQIDKLETRLNHVEELLEQAQGQREMLIQKLESMSGTLTAAQTRIQELMESEQGAVDVKLSEITARREAAMTETKKIHTEIQQLHGQLEQQVKSTAALQSQIATLHEMMAPPPVEESVASTDSGKTQSKGPVVGFPEKLGFGDSSVIIIRGPSHD